MDTRHAKHPERNRAARPGSKRYRRRVALLFVLWALLLKPSLPILLAAALTWLSYQVLFKRNKKLIAVTVSSVLSFAAFEYFGGLILQRQMAAKFAPTIDHRLVPGSEPGINQDGIRCDFEADDFSADTFNVIFLGDSFTYGLFIEDAAQAFPGLVESLAAARGRTPRLRAINFGWTSSSPLLSYRLLRDIGAKYQPDLVILCLDMTDFHDDLNYRGRFRALHVSPTVFLFRRFSLEDVLLGLDQLCRLRELRERYFPTKAAEDYFVVHQPLAQSRPLLEETAGNIRRIAQHCRSELKCDFLLVMLPRGFQYDDRESPGNWEASKYADSGPYKEEPFAWLREFAETVDFPCYSLLEDFQQTTVFPTCYEGDPHWNAAGHRVAAEAIVRMLEREGYVPRRLSVNP